MLFQSPPSSISPAQRASTSPGSVDGGGLRRTESPALPDVNVCTCIHMNVIMMKKFCESLILLTHFRLKHDNENIDYNHLNI